MTHHRYDPWNEDAPESITEKHLLSIVLCAWCERDVDSSTVSEEGYCPKCVENYRKRYIKPVSDEPMVYSPEYIRFVKRTLMEIELGL